MEVKSMTVGKAVGEIKNILYQYEIPNYQTERKTPSFSYGDISDRSQ